MGGQTTLVTSNHYVKAVTIVKERELFVVTYQEMINEHQIIILNKVKSLMNQLVEKGNDLISAETDLKSLRKKEGELNDIIGKLEEGNLFCQSSLKTANSRIKKLTEQNQVLSGEKANYKAWYEKKLGESITKATVRELLKEIFARIVGKNG